MQGFSHSFNLKLEQLSCKECLEFAYLLTVFPIFLPNFGIKRLSSFLKDVF